MILQLRFWNSGCNPAMYPSSVVHTGVKSLGCENRIAQPFPIHSWKLILPWVVSAVKLGASELIRIDILISCVIERHLCKCRLLNPTKPTGTGYRAAHCSVKQASCVEVLTMVSH